MVWLPPASTSVWPSGALLGAKPGPVGAAGAGRFSTITLRPSCAPSSALIARARMSCTPPGANGTTMRVMPVPLVGWAAQSVAAIASRAARSALTRRLLLVARLERLAAPLAARHRALARLGAEVEAVVLHFMRGLAHHLLGDGLARQSGAVFLLHDCPENV